MKFHASLRLCGGLLFTAALLFPAPGLQIVRPIVAQMDGGAPDPPGFEHAAGEILFFSCRVTGFTKSSEEQMHIAYSVQAFDAKGVALTELYKNEMTAEVTPQDKEWMPKIATEVPIPPLIAPGTYKILVKVDDVLAKASAQLEVPFLVRGHVLEPSDTLIIRNFRFFRTEDDSSPAPNATYRPGAGVFAQFDITGYQYGPQNAIDVSYVTSVIAPGGRLLWKQPEPAAERTQSFYPKRYVQAGMGINLQRNIRPGDYTIQVEVTDAVGKQTFESKYPFKVE